MVGQRRPDEIRRTVRDAYGKIARTGLAGCGCRPEADEGCCSGGQAQPCCPSVTATRLGYAKQDLSHVPEGADLGLGCGNPQAIAALKPGETVLDLGSGGGLDCFLAARQVGESGRVIGVDMTPEMVLRARENAARAGVGNVEFRLGEIEHLPLADTSVDVIISNCVVNLSPDKPGVFREAFRVLKPGGRIAIVDMVATAPLPEEIRDELALYSGCVAGAATVEELAAALAEAGFTDVRIRPKVDDREPVCEQAPVSGHALGDYVVSAAIEAVKG